MCALKCVEKREPLCWEYKVSAATMAQKIKNSTIICSSTSTTGYVSKGNAISMSMKHLNSHVDCSTAHNSQDMKSTLNGHQ